MLAMDVGNVVADGGGGGGGVAVGSGGVGDVALCC